MAPQKFQFILIGVISTLPHFFCNSFPLFMFNIEDFNR